MGKKAAAARKAHAKEKVTDVFNILLKYWYNWFFQKSEEEEDEDDEEKRKARLHKIRVEAGKKAAATRKAHSVVQVNYFIL
jgi:hypothetical protein